MGALNRVNLATRLKTLFDLPRAIAQSAQIIRNFRPDVIVGVGGYASGPAMLAGAMLHVPLMAFEPNVVPGVANRLVARFVKGSGSPLRGHAEIFPQRCRHRCARAAGVLRHRAAIAGTSVPLCSSSAAARAPTPSTSLSCRRFPQLAKQVPGIHLIHQTGQNDYEAAKAAAASAGISAEVSPFIDDMPGAFARADLLICRSGASTVAEVAAAGKPAIFIPLPTAADDHQRHNAETLADAGAALLLPQSELTPDRLAQDVASLLGDRDRLAQMGAAARQFAHPDAAAEIAAMAARIAGIPLSQRCSLIIAVD